MANRGQSYVVIVCKIVSYTLSQEQRVANFNVSIDLNNFINLINDNRNPLFCLYEIFQILLSLKTYTFVKYYGYHREYDK